MANFLEFLKSGKKAREFIDDAILPQKVLTVAGIDSGPTSFDDTGVDNMPVDDVPVPQPDDLSGVEPIDKAHDIMDQSVLSENAGEAGDEAPDEDFMRQLEALEKTM